jgi:hypothetical protein
MRQKRRDQKVESFCDVGGQVVTTRLREAQHDWGPVCVANDPFDQLTNP